MSPSTQNQPASPQSYPTAAQQQQAAMPVVTNQPGAMPSPAHQPINASQQGYGNGHASMHSHSPYASQQAQYGIYEAAGAMYQNGTDYGQSSQQQGYGMYPAPNAYSPASYAMYRTAT